MIFIPCSILDWLFMNRYQMHIVSAVVIFISINIKTLTFKRKKIRKNNTNNNKNIIIFNTPNFPKKVGKPNWDVFFNKKIKYCIFI